MRTLPIAIIAAAVTIPVAGYSQDQGLVDSRVGPSLESSAPTLPGSSTPLERNNP